MNWQPIETAPKDGTDILVYQTDTLSPNHFVVSWNPVYWGDEGWWMCCDGKNTELPLRGPGPTHWAPLTSPNADDSNADAG